jgi:hypothetical protein
MTGASFFTIMFRQIEGRVRGRLPRLDASRSGTGR